VRTLWAEKNKLLRRTAKKRQRAIIPREDVLKSQKMKKAIKLWQIKSQ
jgi:hypothetical protein